MQKRNWGVIFDWDGVIIDSSRQHELAWERMARERGSSLAPGIFKRSFGMRNDQVLADLFQWTKDPVESERLSSIKEGYYREIVRAEGIKPLGGVGEWIANARREGVPLAVGSSTLRANIDCVIEVIQLQGAFDAIVSAEDVTRGKPAPEVFLKAAEGLHLPAERCVVFEDAHVGIEAARAAKMKVVALSTTHPPETLADADRVVASLDDLPLTELDRWFAGRS